MVIDTFSYAFTPMGICFHGFFNKPTNNVTNHDAYFLVVDQFLKMEILVHCKNDIVEKDTLKLYLVHVWVNFKLPTSIFIDRDPRLISKFYKSI